MPEKQTPDSADPEAQSPSNAGRFSNLQMVLDQGIVNDYIIHHHYPGAGSEDDPYIVNWLPNDPRNPFLFSQVKKWSLTMVVAFATLAVAFVSSAYSGGVKQVIAEYSASQELVTLGVSLFVLGFALGPLIWAPLSELYGRQYLFFGTYALLTFFNAGAAGSQNVWTLIILRFFAGAFGSSPLTNAGGVIADMFTAEQRGIALSIFAAAPFMGPVLGPIVGGFVGETIGWRWIEGIMAIFTGVLWLAGGFFVPETYAPVLLRQRAARLSKITGKVYRSKPDAEQGKVSLGTAFKTSLSRPWILLFREPIVFMLSLYMAIIYGTLYMLFAAYPIVYQQSRGWSQGIGGLPFLGIAVGMIFAVAYSIWDNKRYITTARNSPGGFAPPEARLPPAMIGGIAIPIGLFWFAWTNYPSVHFMASISAGVPFGFGMVLVFLSIMNYLIDAYVIFAASVLAANAVLRSVFGAVFPLFTSYMYQSLGIHWASSIPAFLALACTPFPFLFYKYGPPIRVKCKFAAEADAFLRKMRDDNEEEEEDSDHTSNESTEAKEKEEEARHEAEEEREAEAIDYSYADIDPEEPARFERTRSGTLRKTTSRSSIAYQGNPFDLDRINTHETFSRSRSNSRAASLKSKKSNRSLRK